MSYRQDVPSTLTCMHARAFSSSSCMLLPSTYTHMPGRHARRYLSYMHMPKIPNKNVSTACTPGS